MSDCEHKIKNYLIIDRFKSTRICSVNMCGLCKQTHQEIELEREVDRQRNWAEEFQSQANKSIAEEAKLRQEIADLKAAHNRLEICFGMASQGESGWMHKYLDLKEKIKNEDSNS